jgi:hypothetical protein
MVHEVSKTLEEVKHFYSDIIEAGGLKNALQNKLKLLNSKLIVEDLEDNQEFIVYACVKGYKRISQMYIAKENRYFTFDFWSQGVLLGNGGTDNLIDAAKAINDWNSTDCSIYTLQKRYKFIKADKKQKPMKIMKR